MIQIKRETERDMTQSYEKKALTPTENPLKATTQHKYTNKNFDYRAIVDRLRTISWSNEIHLTGVVKAVYRIPTFPLTNRKRYKIYFLNNINCT